MCDRNEAWDSKGLWSPYSPDARTPWDLRRVVHLHRRAGFGATWTELQRDLKDGPGASIDRLLTGKTRAESVPEDFESVSAALAARGTPARTQAFPDSRPADPSRLRAWWVYRMYNGPDPLGERLALMWHNHFATSDLKVRDLAAMGQQNETFRRLARAPFADLLRAMARDPALLVWLDAPANRKGRPNENLAREFLELFTLGIGNYSESDVREAARALTGWAAGDDPSREAPELHDPGEKTILGKTGKWTGGDLIRIVLYHPALARRLAWRVCEFLLGEDAADAADAAALGALAAGLRANKLDIGWAVGTVLRSRRFFADGNIGSRVQGPAEFAVGVARSLGEFDTPPRSILLAEWAGRFGQELFYPPSVGGWPGGREWLTTQRVIARANYAVALVEGKLSERPRPFDAAGLAERHGRGRDLESVVTFCAELLTGGPAEAVWVRRLVKSLTPKPGGQPVPVAAAVALLIAAPEVQLA